MAEVDSDEARRSAHNASRRRSYARHRESINQKRRDIYRLTKGERRSVASRSGSPIRRSTCDPPETRHTQVNSVRLHSALYTDALKKVEDAYMKFVVATMATPKGHTDIVYLVYQESITISPPDGSRSIIDNSILQMSSIAQTIRECRRVVLDSNDGGDLRLFDLALDPVNRLIEWLEEILYEALASPEGLRHKYIHKELAFQNYVFKGDMYQWFGLCRLFAPR
ncbi:hypothetical protein EV421DRAFT_1773676 [Armillaria borealis]|uniref:Uncharacterized protein n=1 Tax=Armillaria borealis TaxID=47425 RepID=A0AA39MZS1_9AGAR|nr:hypothetical protein EV421DRAFT_1773676 [Armillaria borealis]